MRSTKSEWKKNGKEQLTKVSLISSALQPSGVPQVQGIDVAADSCATECLRGGARRTQVHSVLRVSHLRHNAAAKGHQSLLAVHSALSLAHIAVGGPLRQRNSWCGSTGAWTFR